MSKISQLQSEERTWDKGCAFLRQDNESLLTWTQFTENDDKASVLSTQEKDVFSYFQKSTICNKEVVSIETEHIEPLVSFLRHPFAICFRSDDPITAGKDYLLDKSYIVLKRNQSESPFSDIPRKAYLFDLGASSYNSGMGGASQSWLIESYRKKGIEFSHIYAWEANGIQKDLLQETPDDILLKITYFALPVESGLNNTHSALRFINDLCTPDDFVVLKLDIDFPDLENEIVSEILENSHIQSLIDEVSSDSSPNSIITFANQ